MFETVGGVAFMLALLLVLLPLLLTTPLANVLNVITVPLGYEISSCPYCPEFSINKVSKSECEHCGEEHIENFGAAKYAGDGEFRFCDSDCLEQWKEVSE